MLRIMLLQYLSEYFGRKLVVYIITIIRQFYQFIFNSLCTVVNSVQFINATKRFVYTVKSLEKKDIKSMWGRP